MTVRTCKPRSLPTAPALLLIAAMAVAAGLVPAQRAVAGSLDGAYLYPAEASTNSCRWLIVDFSHDPDEVVSSCTFTGTSRAASLPASTIGWGTAVQSGSGAVSGRIDPNVLTISGSNEVRTRLVIGPFCGDANAFGEIPADWPHVVGYTGP